MDVEHNCANNLGLNLRILRALSGRSQSEVAKELHMSRSNYVYLESGLRDTSVSDALLIEKMTMLSMDTLLHADLQMQMQQYLGALSNSVQTGAFTDAYVQLSQMGKRNISTHIDRLLGEH